ncbi:MAG TPA: hypothetical protein VK557_10440, partial [Pyrinomonadaceae bacterium]|nr:hypothetical protein [Pyrinomonadaceae bacterium]
MNKNYWAALCTAALLIALAVAVSAQVQPKYKEGDRVEVDTIEASNPANAIWKKGTIVKVDTTSSVAYTVQVDPLPGQLPKMMTVPIRPYAEGWLRPLGGAAPQIQSDKLLVDDNGTVLADRELL